MAYMVIWKQEDQNGELQVFSKDFKTKNSAQIHINKLRDSASKLNKKLDILSMTETSYNGPIDKKAYKVNKGKGWHDDRMAHSAARKGVKVR